MFCRATVVTLSANPTGIVRGARFTAILAGDRRQPFGKVDISVNGLRTTAIETKGPELLLDLLNGETRLWPSNEGFEAQTLDCSAPGSKIGVSFAEKFRCHSREPVARGLFDDYPAIWIGCGSGACLYLSVVNDGRKFVDERIPGTKEGFLEKKPSFTEPRVVEFFLDGETQLPDDFKPPVAVVESPAHAGPGHGRGMVLVQDRETSYQPLGQFAIHVFSSVICSRRPVRSEPRLTAASRLFIGTRTLRPSRETPICLSAML